MLCGAMKPWTPLEMKRFIGAYGRELVKAKKEWLKQQKRGQACNMCGFKFPPPLFHFHHTDPATKNGLISKMTVSPSITFDQLRTEVKKCLLLCAECHLSKIHGWVLPKSLQEWIVEVRQAQKRLI
jgi:hypothetical protein